MRQRATRLKDIAEEAKVSVAAVSRILRDQGADQFNVDTQKRVLEAAEKLGWRPNLLVQGLQTGKSGTLGVFVAPFDTYWTGVLYGIHDTILEANNVPLVLWPRALVHPMLDKEVVQDKAERESKPRIGRSPIPDHAGAGVGRREQDRLLRLVDRRVDAIISWPLFEDEAIERMTGLSERGWPIVTIDDQLPEPAQASMVTIDEGAAMRDAVEHLRELGHQRIAFVGLERSQMWATRRIESFRKCVGSGSAGPVCEVQTINVVVRPLITEFLREHSEVTAVICSVDFLALQVIEAAKSLGRSVPSDLSVMGYGNQVFDLETTPLTTIEQNAYAVGETAAQLAMSPAGTTRGIHEVKAELIVRESTAKVK